MIPFRGLNADYSEKEIRKCQNLFQITPKSYPDYTRKKLFKADPDEDDKGDRGTQIRDYLEEPNISRAAAKETHDQRIGGYSIHSESEDYCQQAECK